MITNSDLTIYNVSYNRDTKLIEYNRTYLYGVNWQGENKISVGDKGLNSADSVSILIPFDVSVENNKTYISPNVYKDLSKAEKKNYFTLSNKDIIVKGIIDFNLTSVKPNNLEYLSNLYDDVLTIISVITCDIGSSYMHHWEVGGK